MLLARYKCGITLIVVLSPSDLDRYPCFLSSLVYLIITHSDIFSPAHILSQFFPISLRLNLLWVLHYLNSTICCHIFLTCLSSLRIRAYLDDIWGSDTLDQRSLCSYCVILDNHLFTERWRNKLQFLIRVQTLSCKLLVGDFSTLVAWEFWCLCH
jgi:hypothetical protein